jgi:hypothetical protein
VTSFVLANAILDAIFWWTGMFVWIVAVALLALCALPEGEALPGVTRLTLFDFGPVIWRTSPKNINTFNRLKEVGYHFAPLGRGWNLGLSIPTWLYRLIHSKRRAA